MAAQARLKNEFKENEKCHNLTSWLNYYHSMSLLMSSNYKYNTAHVLQHILNPFLPSGLSHPYQLDEFISNLRGAWCTFFIFILFLIQIPVSKHKRKGSGEPAHPHSLARAFAVHTHEVRK